MANFLVIGCEPVVRGLVRETLARAGHAVEEADLGDAALLAADRSMPELVVVDLPAAADVAAATVRVLRQRLPTLPVVTLSGMPVPRQLLHPPARRLRKPFSPSELVRTVEELLRGA